MKFLVAGFVFFLTLGLSTKSIAAEHETACKPESKECAGAPAVHGGGHNDLATKMNSLFPQPKKNAGLTTKPQDVNPLQPKFLAHVAAGTVKLVWSEAKATDYHVQVATDPNFKWLVVNEKFVKGNAFEFKTAEAGKKYFWRVAAVNPANDTTFTKSNFNSSAFLTQ